MIRESAVAPTRAGSAGPAEWTGAPRGSVFPPVNLYETDDAWVLTAEVPGLRTEDLNVSVDNGRVTLRGERKIEIPAS